MKKKVRKVAIEKVFDVPGDFESFYAAEKWLSENGYSYGSMCAPLPIGILKGDFTIAKWKNLTTEEIAALDGVLEVRRNGKATIKIYES